jgi:hypothetical protein
VSRAPSIFRQRDVRTAIKAAQAAGLEVAAVEISAEGIIRIVAGSPGIQPLGDELDRELAEFEARHGKA